MRLGFSLVHPEELIPDPILQLHAGVQGNVLAELLLQIRGVCFIDDERGLDLPVLHPCPVGAAREAGARVAVCGGPPEETVVEALVLGVIVAPQDGIVRALSGGDRLVEHAFQDRVDPVQTDCFIGPGLVALVDDSGVQGVFVAFQADVRELSQLVLLVQLRIQVADSLLGNAAQQTVELRVIRFREPIYDGRIRLRLCGRWVRQRMIGVDRGLAGLDGRAAPINQLLDSEAPQHHQSQSCRQRQGFLPAKGVFARFHFRHLPGAVFSVLQRRALCATVFFFQYPCTALVRIEIHEIRDLHLHGLTSFSSFFRRSSRPLERRERTEAGARPSSAAMVSTGCR